MLFRMLRVVSPKLPINTQPKCMQMRPEGQLPTPKIAPCSIRWIPTLTSCQAIAIFQYTTGNVDSPPAILPPTQSHHIPTNGQPERYCQSHLTSTASCNMYANTSNSLPLWPLIQDADKIKRDELWLAGSNTLKVASYLRAVGLFNHINHESNNLIIRN